MLKKKISMASSGQKSSSFEQTRYLFSQYLKEKGSFGDFSRGIALKPEVVESSRPQPASTMNFLPNLENFGASSSSSVKAADFFNNKAEATTEDGAGSQMTIFYAGKVHVFNDFSAEKAKEIMAVVNKFGSSINTSGRAFTPDLNIASSVPELNNIDSQDRLIHLLKLPQAPITSDFTIKRSNSLHRFFEKRRQRAAAKAPYQINGASVAPAKPEESSKKSWQLEELEAQSFKQLDLKL